MNEKSKEVFTLYELINLRIKEIEEEIMNAKTDTVARHLQKSLDFNKMILLNMLSKEPNQWRHH